MSKYNYEFKIQVVTAYQNHEGGCRKLAKRFNVHINTITLWCGNYKIFGKSAFKEEKNKNHGRLPLCKNTYQTIQAYKTSVKNIKFLHKPFSESG